MFMYFVDASYIVQLSTDQHKGRIAIWESVLHTDSAENLPVQPFNHIVGVHSKVQYSPRKSQ